MAYTFITHVPGRSLADHRTVTNILGDGAPEGRLLSIAGDADGALHVVDIWDSKASADRFAAERLFPAFQEAGLRAVAEATYVGFESDGPFLNINSALTSAPQNQDNE